MLSEIEKEKEQFADQVYNRYLETAYMVNAPYNDEWIDNLYLCIETSNICFPLKNCVNETC